MKAKLISFISVISVLIMLFTFSASAEKIADYNIDFSLPNEFIVLTEKNAGKNIDTLKSMGFTESSFKSYINNNNIVLFASLPNKSCQIAVNVVSTDFSKETEDFDYLDNEHIERLLPELISGEASLKKIDVLNGSKFVITENFGNDKAGEFYYLQYVTVKNQNLYTVTLSFDESIPEGAAYAGSLMQTFTVSKAKEKITLNGVQNIATYVILVVVIVALAVVIVYIIYTVISDIVRNRNTSDVAPYVKIKRRRFK